jgi:hypothetical protein
MTTMGTLQIYTLIVVVRKRAKLGGFRSEVRLKPEVPVTERGTSKKPMSMYLPDIVGG